MSPLNELQDSYNIYSAWYSVLPTTGDYSLHESGIIFQLEPSVFNFGRAGYTSCSILPTDLITRDIFFSSRLSSSNIILECIMIVS